MKIPDMRSRLAQCLGIFLLSCANHAWSLELDGQHFSDDQIFTVVIQKFKKTLSHRFNPADTSDRKPLLVLGEALKFGRKIQSSSFVHLTQQELVTQQHAVFILVSKAHPDPAQKELYVYYDMPSSASFGILKLTPKEGMLSAQTYDSYRSSSGARATYASLYAGISCTDNSEMSYRWNYYEKRSGGLCAQAKFTEF